MKLPQLFMYIHTFIFCIISFLNVMFKYANEAVSDEICFKIIFINFQIRKLNPG